MEEVIFSIGGIGNFYGGLRLREDNKGGFSWSITNYDGDDWETIPAYLAQALIQYENERTEPTEVEL